MSNIIFTVGITFLIITLCLFMLGISWFLTGKAKLRLGMCGRTPSLKKNKSKGCGTDPQCPLCGANNDEDVSEKSA